MCDKEENDMAVTENVKIDVKKSLAKSLQEVEDIRKGKLPKRSSIKYTNTDLHEMKIAHIKKYFLHATN